MSRSDLDDQVLAYDAISSAWDGLGIDRRQDVIDLLSTYDFDLAFTVLLKSPTIDPDIAARIRARQRQP
ncbi:MULTISPECIES: hypothetical protein [Mycolicibacter]|jgi:hypothetical protein|uniref:Uncharacterized protein n=1 Tax=Mycolicibacter arupensis TaxID=342002 RepID=A0A0F5MTP2_9MYCO|nr:MULTISPECIES: hypothetical protein [Mycolicibacter]KAA1430968.1 hypothetical protein F0402_11385 [Mycolicibacter arupensis]KKB97964.1 hypothetical protein WR43_16805 [Mycolicibacter arupensis]MCV7274277.1 hypothetical protein [Mycolicibacter arupensis]OQZ92209.1 hypothetical protein BST15_19245 [Mycolicibacter arupensis]